MAKPIIESLVVSVKDAALLLDVSEATIWRMIARKELATALVGQSRKIRIRDIERYLDQRTIPATRR